MTMSLPRQWDWFLFCCFCYCFFTFCPYDFISLIESQTWVRLITMCIQSPLDCQTLKYWVLPLWYKWSLCCIVLSLLKTNCLSATFFFSFFFFSFWNLLIFEVNFGNTCYIWKKWLFFCLLAVLCYVWEQFDLSGEQMGTAGELKVMWIGYEESHLVHSDAMHNWWGGVKLIHHTCEPSCLIAFTPMFI